MYVHTRGCKPAKIKPCSTKAFAYKLTEGGLQ